MIPPLDLHASVAAAMMHQYDALLDCETYPHSDYDTTGERARGSASAISLEEAAARCGLDEDRSGLADQTEEELVATYSGFLIRIAIKHERRDLMPAHVVVLGEERARLFANGDTLGAGAHIDAAINCALEPAS